MKITRSTEVSAKELAAVLGVSDRRVRQYVEEEVIPAIGNNKFNLSDCVAAFVEFKTKPVTYDGDGKVIDFNEQRARKTKLEADKIEFQNKIDTGKYRLIEEVTGEMQDAVRVSASVLNNLKLNIARLAPELPNRALDAIEKESAKALTAIIELDENYKAIEAEVNDSVDIST